jgi:hypothetical protein
MKNKENLKLMMRAVGDLLDPTGTIAKLLARLAFNFGPEDGTSLSATLAIYL